MPTFKIKQNGSWVYVSPPGYSNKEDKANKVTSWQATTDNDHYPTEKLVKDSLDNKQNAITQSASAPTNPSVGDYWDDTNDVVYSTTGQTTVVVDQAIIDGSVNPVSGNAVHDALVTLDTKLTSKSATASDVGKFAKVKTVDTATGTVSEWEFGIGGSGDGSSDFDVLTNRPQYNGTVMTHSTNIPQVKTTTWDAKYDKPSEGIPKTDLASGVQTSLDKADSALQQQSLSTYRTWAAQDVIDNGKVDKVTGKGLSTEDYTTAEKTKLSGIEPGAEINVQSDWSQSDDTADDYIKNKPTALSDFIDDLDNSPLHTHPQYLTAQSSAISQHTSQITATQGMISDAYVSGHTYAVGEYCIYNNQLWKCLVSNSSTPSEGANWTKKSVSETLATQATAISNRMTRSYVMDGDNTKTTYTFSVPMDDLIHAGFIIISQWDATYVPTVYAIRYRTNLAEVTLVPLSEITTFGCINSISYSNGELTIVCASAEARFINIII